MSRNPTKRKCSAVCRNGHPCKAWAVIESEPALCSAHAGLNVGAGAPVGNQNGIKHGYYTSIMRPDDIVDTEIAERATPMAELVMLRSSLRRMYRCMQEENQSLDNMVSIMPHLISGARAVVYLKRHIDERDDEWGEVLDRLGEELGIDI